MIFVFGSNTAGRHGKGAALTAKKHHGAIQGQCIGMMGNSYAIPTCNHAFQPLPLEIILVNTQWFLKYAYEHSRLQFQVTRIGCGLAYYHDKDIAPMFAGAPDNVFFDETWRPYLGETHEYWGTY